MAELIGLISGILGIADAISKSYEEIKKIKNLPEAFQTVEGNLGIVEEALTSAKQTLNTNSEQANKGRVKNNITSILGQCRVRAETLRDIFQEVAKCVEKERPGNWQQLKRFYKGIILRFRQYKKAEAVEGLMRELLVSVHELANLQIFRSQSLLEKINSAVDKLAEIQDEDPTLTEEEMKESPANIQNNYGEGQANQFNPSGGENTFNTTGVANSYYDGRSGSN